jgi:hypothetical protein
MIKTYLRLDLFKKSIHKKYLEISDQIDLELSEDVHDALQGFDYNYAELCLVIDSASYKQESLVCCFRSIKLKGKADRHWVTCEQSVI